MSDLYHESRKELEEHLSTDHRLVLTGTELFDIWETATRQMRKELKRLERLVQFQVDGRVKDAEQRNTAISQVNYSIDSLKAQIEGNCKTIVEQSEFITRLQKRISVLSGCLQMLDRKGGLGSENHEMIRKALDAITT